MDCGLPDFSVHAILQARIQEWVAVSSPGYLWTQESNLGLLHCRQILYQLSCEGSLLNLLSIFEISYVVYWAY